MKKVLLTVLVLFVVLTIAAAVFYYYMKQPLYTPGMVRAAYEQNSAAFKVPQQATEDSTFWLVEKGVRLYHTSQGEGEDVLIVHGGPGRPYHKEWPGLQAFTSTFKFHYYHQRGAGKSSRPLDRFKSHDYYENLTRLESTLGLAAQVADIERIRQLLGKEKIILVGHSFGAFLAALYAVEFPQRVKGLVLIAPALVMVLPSEENLFEQISRRLKPAEQKSFGRFLETYMDFSSLFNYNERVLANRQLEFGKFYQQAFKNDSMLLPAHAFKDEDVAGWAVYAQFFSMGQDHDYRPYFKDLAVPALIVHGGQDLQSSAGSKSYMPLFSDVRFVQIDGAGHFPFYSHPQ